MVFENIVSSILLKYLGDYVKNLDRDNLKVGIWGGDVTLRDLEINGEALDVLDLPFVMTQGVIGNLVLKVPWKSLKSAPVVVQISEVFLVLAPKFRDHDAYDEEADLKRRRGAKNLQLHNAELVNNIKEKDGESQSSGFFAKMATKIVDNLQFEISQIHVRIEDSQTDPEHPFAVGFCLDQITINSTDEKWAENEVVGDVTGSLIRKLGKLCRLSAYFDPLENAQRISKDDDIKSVKVKMARGITDEGNVSSHHYVVQPISAQLQLSINPSDAPDSTVPKVSANLTIDDICLVVERYQYQSVLKLVESVSQFNKMRENLKFRPQDRPSNGPNARLWWKYAGTVVLKPIQERLRRKSWKYITERLNTMRRYISLYKRSKGKQWLSSLSKEETADLQRYEDELDVHDILYFRSLADAELTAEQHNADEAIANKKSQIGGWFQKIFSSNNVPEEDLPNIELTEEQRDVLYSTINYNEKSEQHTELPREYIKLRSNVSIKKAAVSITDAERHGEILHAAINDVTSAVDVRGVGLKVKLSVGSFEVEDKFSEKTINPKLLTRSDNAQEGTPLLQLDVEQSPADGRTDMVVDAQFQATDIFFNSALIIKLVGVFEPEVPMLVTSELKDKAKEKAREISQNTKTRLADAQTRHKTIEMKLRFKAPRIVIPQNAADKDTPLLVVDLGLLTVGTEQPPLSDQPVEDSGDALQIALSQVQVLLVTKASLDWQHKENRLVLKPVDVTVSYCNTSELTRIDAKITHVVLSLTYQDFKLISGVATEFQRQLPQPVVDDREEKELEGGRLQRGIKKSTQKRLRPKKTETLYLTCQTAEVTLVNDFEGRNIPLALLRISETSAVANNWSHDMDAAVEIKISIDYYNHLIVTNQPLLEEFAFKIIAQGREEPQMSISIQSNDRFNLNVSHALIDNLIVLKNILTKDYLDDGAEKSAERVTEEGENGRQFSPYWLINETGIPITVIVNDVDIQMHTNDEVPLGYNNFREKTGENPENTSVGRDASLVVGQYNVPKFSLDKVGSQEFEIGSGHMLCKIVLVDGSKLVTFQSLASVKNSCTKPIYVAFFSKSDDPEPKVMGPVDPAKKISVPLECVEKGVMVARPADVEAPWEVRDENSFAMTSIKTLIGSKDPEKSVEGSFTHGTTRLMLTATTAPVMDGDLGHCEIELIITPPIILENKLPITLTYSIYNALRSESKTLESGDDVAVYDLSTMEPIMSTLKIEGYSESEPVAIAEPKKKKLDQIFRFRLKGDRDDDMDLYVERRIEGGSYVLAAYSGYAIVNHSGLNLQWKPKQGAEERIHFSADASSEDEKPVLFSSFGDEKGGNRILLKIADGDWSEAFNIDSVGTTGVIQSRTSDGKIIEIGASISLGESHLRRTKVIEFSPRFILENGSDADVIIRQTGTQSELKIKAGQSAPLYSWTEAEGKRKLDVKLDGVAEWSNNFDVDTVSTFSVKIPTSGESKYRLYSVEIVQDDVTITVTITNNDQNEPVQIINSTKYQMKAHQKDSPQFAFEIPAESETSYTWDFPTDKLILSFKSEEMGIEAEFEPDILDTIPPVQGTQGTLYAYIKANGLRKILHLTTDGDEYKKENEPSRTHKVTWIDFQFEVAGFGLSVIDSTPKELIYVTIDRLYVSFTGSNIDQTAHVTIDDVQIDNQLIDCQYPVMLSYLEKKDEKERLPLLRFTLARDLEHPGIDFISYLSLSLQAMNIKIDTQIINAMIAMVEKLPLTATSSTPLPSSPSKILHVTPVHVSTTTSSTSLPAGTYHITYRCGNGGKMGPVTKFSARSAFSALKISNIEAAPGHDRTLYINDGDALGNYRKLYVISTSSNDDSKTSIIAHHLQRQDGDNVEEIYDGKDTEATENKLVPARKTYFKFLILNPVRLNLTFNFSSGYNIGNLGWFFRALGETFGNLDNASVGLNALILQDITCELDDLVARIRTHYTRHLTQQMYKIVGSADFLGNPVGLFNNFSKGFGDFFYEPVHGMVEGPQAFGKGLAKGTYSLVRNSMFGTFNSASKVTGTVGKGLSQLSLDDDYLVERQKRKATRRPKHIGYGLFYGVESLGEGLKDAVVGVVKNPVKGGQEGGALGAMKGLGKGLLGLPVKPVVGVMDLITNATEGLRNTANIFEKEDQRVKQPKK